MSCVPKICFVSSRPGFVVGDRNFRMDWANQRLIAFLNDRYQQDFSVAFFSDPVAKQSYNSEISVSKLFPLPFPFSHPGGIRNLVEIHRILKKIEKENDILIIQLPIIGFPALLALKKPIIFHLCANVLTAVENPVKYRGVKGAIAKTFANLLHITNRTLFNRKNVSGITNGSELASVYDQFKPIQVLSTSLFREDVIDGAVNLNGLVKGDLRIIFIGRPSLEKGFDVLVKALLALKQSFRLTVIGFTQDDFKSMLPVVFKESGRIHSSMSFYGYLNWGEEFKSIMRDQDQMIMPSRSEGTPRVILEAMSQGIPVIATRAGGIPDIIKDGETGLLFEVNDVAGLCSRIELLATMSKLRSAIVNNAIQFAKKNTVDKFASHFIESIEKLNNEQLHFSHSRRS